MAKNLTILTLNQPDLTDFAAARDAMLKKVKTPWVLFVDSDEVVTPELEKEITKAIESNIFDAYSLPRLDTFLGRPLFHGEVGNLCFVRLARRDWGHWERPVHEQWIGPGRVGKLNEPLLHTPHQSLSTFVSKIDHYSTLDSEYRFSQGKRGSLFHITFFPLAKFIQNYFWRLGFLDGVPGMVHAFMMSWHSYLTWSKLYLLARQNP